MNTVFKKIADNDFFQRFILFLILVSAMSMGVEAVPALQEDYDQFLFYLDVLIQVIFVCEITIRVLAFAPKIGEFFKDRWNTFDFAVVVLSLIPVIGSFALIARLLRLLRILRLLSVSDKLRSFMTRLSGSLDESLSALFVAAIGAYIFIIAGHYLYGETDPARWGDLRQSTLSVFYLALFQDVKSFVTPLAERSLGNLMFFVSFYASLLSLAVGVLTAAVREDR
jgi:voltage-gated sodium channel